MQQAILLLMSPGDTQQQEKRIFSWSTYFDISFKTSSSNSEALIKKKKLQWSKNQVRFSELIDSAKVSNTQLISSIWFTIYVEEKNGIG